MDMLGDETKSFQIAETNSYKMRGEKLTNSEVEKAIDKLPLSMKSRAFLLLLVVSLLLLETSIVSAQVEDEDLEERVTCVVYRESTGPEQFRSMDDPGVMLEYLDTTNVILTCDGVGSDEPVQLELNLLTPDRSDFNFLESENEFLEMIRDGRGGEPYNILYLSDHPLTDDPDVNCHSFTLQSLQEIYGFDLTIGEDDWDNKGFIQYFSYLFTESIEHVDVENPDEDAFSNLQVGDYLLFHLWSDAQFDEEGNGLLHSAVVIDYAENGEPIIRSKFGKAGVADAVGLRGALDIAQMFGAEQIDVKRLDVNLTTVNYPTDTQQESEE